MCQQSRRKDSGSGTKTYTHKNSFCGSQGINSEIYMEHSQPYNLQKAWSMITAREQFSGELFSFINHDPFWGCFYGNANTSGRFRDRTSNVILLRNRSFFSTRPRWFHVDCSLGTKTPASGGWATTAEAKRIGEEAEERLGWTTNISDMKPTATQRGAS